MLRPSNRSRKESLMYSRWAWSPSHKLFINLQGIHKDLEFTLPVSKTPGFSMEYFLPGVESWRQRGNWDGLHGDISGGRGSLDSVNKNTAADGSGAISPPPLHVPLLTVFFCSLPSPTASPPPQLPLLLRRAHNWIRGLFLNGQCLFWTEQTPNYIPMI